MLAHGVTKFQKAYASVQDLNVVRANYAFKSHDKRALVSRSSPSTQLHKSYTFPHMNDVNRKSFKRDNKNKGTERNFLRLPLLNAISDKYMGISLSIAYNPVKIVIIDRAPIEAPKSDLE